MPDTFLKLYVLIQNLTRKEEGQDLVEYALLLIMISLVLVTSIQAIASEVVTTFTAISTSL